MNYQIYGPFEIPLAGGEFKRRIDKEDIAEFWKSVAQDRYVVSKEIDLKTACGIYIFSIRTKQAGEKPWYVGKASKQDFSQECFTKDKILRYHEALEKSRGEGTPMMYLVARFTQTGRSISKPSSSVNGHAEMDFVETMFIGMGYNKNNDIRNTKGTRYSQSLVIEGFYNHKDRRRIPAKRLHDLFST